MAGYFSRMFDPPTRPSFFGPQASDDNAADQRAQRQPFFSPDPLLFLSARYSDGMVVPAVANFGVKGPSVSEYTDPDDWPWQAKIYPDVDPRMPFFVLPPNAVFNMPVYKGKLAPRRVPPWVDKQGQPHLDLINPDYDQLITPGRDT